MRRGITRSAPSVASAVFWHCGVAVGAELTTAGSDGGAVSSPRAGVAFASVFLSCCSSSCFSRRSSASISSVVGIEFFLGLPLGLVGASWPPLSTYKYTRHLFGLFLSWKVSGGKYCECYIFMKRRHWLLDTPFAAIYRRSQQADLLTRPSLAMRLLAFVVNCYSHSFDCVAPQVCINYFKPVCLAYEST